MGNKDEHRNVTIGEAHDAKREQLKSLTADLVAMILRSTSSDFHNCEAFLSNRIKEQVVECEKIEQLGRTIVFWKGHDANVTNRGDA